MPCFVRFNLFKNIHSLSTFYIQSVGLGVVRIKDPQGMILGHFRSAVVITFTLHKARLFPWRKSASIGTHRRKSTVRWIRLCILGFGAGKWGKLGNDKCFCVTAETLVHWYRKMKLFNLTLEWLSLLDGKAIYSFFAFLKSAIKYSLSR